MHILTVTPWFFPRAIHRCRRHFRGRVDLFFIRSFFFLFLLVGRKLVAWREEGPPYDIMFVEKMDASRATALRVVVASRCFGEMVVGRREKMDMSAAVLVN